MDGLNFRIPGDRLSPPRLFRQVDWRVINRRLEVEDDGARESSKNQQPSLMDSLAQKNIENFRLI